MKTTDNQQINEERRKANIRNTEYLRIGERVAWMAGVEFSARCQKLGVKLWVEKSRPTTTRDDRTLSGLIADFAPYALVYGIHYKGCDYAVGDMPRDLEKVVKGIEIATT